MRIVSQWVTSVSLLNYVLNGLNGKRLHVGHQGLEMGQAGKDLRASGNGVF